MATDGDPAAVVEDGPVIEMDQPPDDRQARLPWRWIAAVALLLAGGIGGYALGDRHSRARAAPATTGPPADVNAGGPDLEPGAGVVVGGDTCAVLTGQVLQLGADISNVSFAPITLQSVTVGLPMGGLHLKAQAWGTCGQSPPLRDATPVLPPAGTLWFTATFDLLDTCPVPYPVLFTVKAVSNGRSTVTPVNVFPDLGRVHFPSCND